MVQEPTFFFFLLGLPWLNCFLLSFTDDFSVFFAGQINLPAVNNLHFLGLSLSWLAKYQEALEGRTGVTNGRCAGVCAASAKFAQFAEQLGFLNDLIVANVPNPLGAERRAVRV